MSMYRINARYQNSRWIDLNRWSEAPEVRRLVSHLVEKMPGRKKDPFKASMKILLMNLYHGYLTDEEQYIAYHRGKEHYLRNPLITHPHVTYTSFIGCINFLWNNRYIENKEGGRFYDEVAESYHSYVSRMRADKPLWDLWDQHKWKAEMITAFKPNDQYIRLMGPKEEKTYTYNGKAKKRKVKRPMPYPNTPEVRRMNSIIQKYNDLLDRTRIDLDIECISSKDREKLVTKLKNMSIKDKKIILRMADKQVYRVFNNGSFTEGGRFYGAWWIGAPSIVRKYITINGNTTVELDYSGIHIHLLYALQGINYADLKEDAYTLDDGILDKKLNKLILLTAFNAKNDKKALAAVFDELRKDGLLKEYDIHSWEPLKKKLALLKAKHQPIQDMIAKGFGLKLQYYDSCVIDQLIARFTKLGIPILTVHDSVICEERYADFVLDKMLSIYASTIDQLTNTNIPYTLKAKHAGNAMDHIIRSNPYLQRWKDSGLNQIKSMVTKWLPWLKSYNGKHPEVEDSIINVKQDKRENRCYGNCNHSSRANSTSRYQRSIKLALFHNQESYTDTLMIK